MNTKFSKFLFMLLFQLISSQAPAESYEVADLEYAPEGNTSVGTLGIGRYKIEQDKLGFYFNLFTNKGRNVDSQEPPYKQDVLIIDAGATGHLEFSESIIPYAGIGYAQTTCTSSQIQTSHPNSQGACNDYSPIKDRYGVNLNVGTLIEFNKLVFNMGYHSFLKSAYLGVGWKF